MKANKKRIKEHIEALSQFTEIKGGVQRISYSKEYKQASDYLLSLMHGLDMDTHIDEIGNIYGVLRGKSNNTICSGSHLDTVRNAGAFDGAAGIVAALEVAYMLKEKNIKLNHSYKVLCTIGEEGTRFNQTLMGSQFMCGIHAEKELDNFIDNEGNSLRKVKEDYGLRKSIKDIVKNIEDIDYMLELHGEQGPVLEKEKLKIGIVSNIAGIVWLDVSVKGMSNHAGTTPMNLRKDAGIFAYKMIEEINDYVKNKYTNKATFTIGKLQLKPGSSNCIPNECNFTIDIRSGKQEIINDILIKISEYKKVSKKEGMSISITKLNQSRPVAMNKLIQNEIEKSCINLSIPYRYMDSGAGHDSMIFAKKFPTAMIFVPNKDGISHNPKEFINYNDLEKGAEVLFDTVCSLDKKRRSNKNERKR